jgi:flagellar capping protein FliD
MTGETEDTGIADFVHERFRRIDGKLDRILDAIETLTRRQSSLEARMTALEQNQAHGFAHLHERIDLMQGQLDKVNERLGRIEKRLDLVEA